MKCPYKPFRIPGSATKRDFSVLISVFLYLADTDLGPRYKAFKEVATRILRTKKVNGVCLPIFYGFYETAHPTCFM